MADLGEAKWYVVHTYSGYENKVMTDLEKMVENRGMQDLIQDIRIPTEIVTEIGADGKEKQVERKIFPGYVMIKMIVTDDSWYVVRNTRGCTGFVGPASKPVPLTDAEMKSMGLMREAELTVDFSVGDAATIVSGAFEGAQGIISAINLHKQVVTVNIELLGRETPVEISFTDVRVENY